MPHINIQDLGHRMHNSYEARKQFEDTAERKYQVQYKNVGATIPLVKTASTDNHITAFRRLNIEFIRFNRRTILSEDEILKVGSV
jgi:hypothetical protein